MDLRGLRSFVVLAQHEHFTRAAAELGLVQSALSKQIRALEDDLGVRLFERTRRHVRLSHAGAALIDPARRALQAADDVPMAARRLRDGATGHLHIGFTPTAPAVVLAQAVRAFRRRHPHVACRVTQASSEELLDAIARMALDVALVRLDAAARRPNVACVSVLEEPLVAAVGRGSRLARRRTLAWVDLAAEPFVMVRRQAAPVVYDQILSACRGAGFSPTVIESVHDIHGVLAVVATGGGVAVVPASTRAMPSVARRPLVGPTLSTALGLAWLASGEPPGARAFVRLVRMLSPGSRSGVKGAAQ